MNEQLIRARVFISHNHSDKDFARRVGMHLLKKGHEVWLDKWELLPGDSLTEKISDGMINSSYLLVLLSKKSVASNWVQRELEIAINRQLKDKSIKVIPCLLEECDIPTFLSPVFYADFRESFEDGINQLLPAIKMVDINTFGQSKEDAWTHDFVYDYNFNTSKHGGYYINLTAVSQYFNFEGSIIFTFKIKTSHFLTNRFDSMPDYINPVLKAVLFIEYFRDVVDFKKKESTDDFYILSDSNNLSTNDFEIKHPDGSSFFYVSTTLRVIGTKPDNDIKYNYGALVLEVFEKSLREIRQSISPRDGQIFAKWIVENPIK